MGKKRSQAQGNRPSHHDLGVRLQFQTERSGRTNDSLSDSTPLDRVAGASDGQDGVLQPGVQLGHHLFNAPGREGTRSFVTHTPESAHVRIYI